MPTVSSAFQPKTATLPLCCATYKTGADACWRYSLDGGIPDRTNGPARQLKSGIKSGLTLDCCHQWLVIAIVHIYV